VRFILPLMVLGLAVLAGCSSASFSKNGNSITIKNNEVPAAVQGAFASEHPYAKMTEPKKVTDSDGVVTYVVPYTRADGSTGSASYSDMGELKSDN
jgi:hypothetical protein